MQFLIDNWMLIAVAAISGAMLFYQGFSGSAKSGLSPNQAVQLMNHEKAVVIDVCEPKEFAAGHVNGARNVPFGALDKQLEGVAKNKSLPLILVCASGARSGRALSMAKKLGYERAYSLTGGMGAWRSANLPVAKG